MDGRDAEMSEHTNDAKPSDHPADGMARVEAVAAVVSQGEPQQNEVLQQALKRIKSLEGELSSKDGELSTLKREHERTTAKLSHLLKKRGAGDDAADTETEASQELQTLRQAVSVLKWREEQYRQIIAKAAAARCATRRPSPHHQLRRPLTVSLRRCRRSSIGASSQPPVQQQQPAQTAGIPDTICVGQTQRSSSGSSTSSSSSGSVPRVASNPCRQITPPEVMAPKNSGVKRPAPATTDAPTAKRHLHIGSVEPAARPAFGYLPGAITVQAAGRPRSY